MLIEMNISDSRTSIYECDMCGKRFIGVLRVKISKNSRKAYDLCSRCSVILDRFIVKYRERRKNERNKI